MSYFHPDLLTPYLVKQLTACFRNIENNRARSWSGVKEIREDNHQATLSYTTYIMRIEMV